MDIEYISVGLAIFFGITTLILTVKMRRKRSLCYTVISETPLLSIKERIREDIKIIYRNEEVKDLHFLLIGIENDGNEPLQMDDFKKPITFMFNSQAKILEDGIAYSHPEDLQISSDRKADNEIGFVPELLNPKESFVLKFVLTEYDNFNVQTRVVGLKEIKKHIYSSSYENRLNHLFQALFSIGFSAVVWLLFASDRNLAILIPVFLLWLSGLLITFRFLTYRLRRTLNMIS